MSDISKNKASNLTREIEIVKITPEESKKIKDRIVCEVPLTIILNGIRLIKLKCSPDQKGYKSKICKIKQRKMGSQDRSGK